MPPPAGKLREELEELIREEGNNTCADCGQKDPDWASINLGVFLCIHCSGVHRNLGTHISKVRSVQLDTWTGDQVQCMRDGGNVRAKAEWEQIVPFTYPRPPPGDAYNPVVREQWIRAKYERKEFQDQPEAIELRALYTSGKKEGFLLKRGKDNNKWQRRWFVLTETGLSYFVSEKDIPSNPKETLPLLETFVSITSEHVTGKPYGLELSWQKVGGDAAVRNYFLAADDSRSFIVWLSALRAAKAKALGLTTEAEVQAAPLLAITPAVSGYLSKQGPKEKSWKRRWFTLHGNLLVYYKTPTDSVPLGFSSVGTSTQGFQAAMNQKAPQGLCFQLTTPSRTYSLQADSKELVAHWVGRLQAAIATASDADPVAQGSPVKEA